MRPVPALRRKHSPLDGKLRALFAPASAQLNHCHFCADLNASDALGRGVTEQQPHGCAAD